MFDVKKRAFSSTLKNGLVNFKFPWLKTFALYKVEVFDIMLKN